MKFFREFGFKNVIIRIEKLLIKSRLNVRLFTNVKFVEKIPVKIHLNACKKYRFH